MLCPNCHKDAPEDSRFCLHCGCSLLVKDPLGTAEPIAPAPAPAPAPARRRSPLTWILAALALTLALWLGRSLWLPPPQESQDQLYERLCRSMLMLEVYDADQRLLTSASGFVAGDGYTVVTNAHVLPGAERLIAYTESGDSFDLWMVAAYDQAADLALLRSEEDTGLAPLELAEFSQAERGQEVFVISSPLGLEDTIAQGMISALWDDGGLLLIQTSVPLSQSSGGALFNTQGQALGVTSAAIPEGQNLNMAVAADHVAALLSVPGREMSLGYFNRQYLSQEEEADPEPPGDPPPEAEPPGDMEPSPQPQPQPPSQPQPQPQPEPEPEQTPSYNIWVSPSSATVAIGGSVEFTISHDCPGAQVYLGAVSGPETYSQSYVWYEDYTVFTIYGEAPGTAALRFGYYPHNDSSQGLVSREVSLTVVEEQ